MSAPSPDDDPMFQKLMADLTERWATVSADDELEVVAKNMRAAYGFGYVEVFVSGARAR